ncbi:HAD family hydrolase [Mycobacterium sp. AMU20-3851]|uniref:HAD family hydrolase n=1 Tax=Mycobacterium sp. AMU20-3851 TaxID=3122055 RepID=UPI00375487B3
MSGNERPPAVLFDVDGTLVDSNYLHVHAWYRAFSELRIPVQSWQIHRSIGMDGEKLLETLAAGVNDDVRDELKELHSQYYKQTTSLLSPLPGAREILDRIDSLGLQVVLATSAPEDELATLRAVLDRDELVSVVTSAGDVETAKPEPDIVQIALGRAEVSPQRAVFVGDAVWDAQAGVAAGVTCIGVLSGGVSRSELEQAGATVVFDNALDLCERLTESPVQHLIELL